MSAPLWKEALDARELDRRTRAKEIRARVRSYRATIPAPRFLEEPWRETAVVLYHCRLCGAHGAGDRAHGRHWESWDMCEPCARLVLECTR